MTAAMLIPELELPDVLAHSAADNSTQLSILVAARLACFAGHFPSRPVVPGVVQLGWALAFARHYLGVRGEMQRMEAVKFHHVIEPDQHLDLKLSYEPARQRVQFVFYSADVTYSSGRLVLA